MTGALIGLIGVIVGALLGGLLTFGVEASKRRKVAYAAGSLIATELTIIINRLMSAFPESGQPERWQGSLPTTAWDARAADLVAYGIPAQIPGKPEPVDPKVEELAMPEPIGPSPLLDQAAPDQAAPDQAAPDQAAPDQAAPDQAAPDQAHTDLLTKLGVVYATVDRWNNAPKDAQPRRSDLIRDIKAFSSVRGDLQRYTRSLEGRGRTSFRRVASVLIPIVVLVIAVFLLATPRADVTSDTVAAALQNHLGSADFVHCDSSGVGDWQCVDHHLSEPLGACRAAVAASRTATGVSIRLAVQLRACTETAPPTPYGVVAEGAELAVLRENPADREMRKSAYIAEMSAPAFSPWKRFWGWLQGK